MSDALDEADLKTAVLVFAHYLGIDIETEQELLKIAENALKTLPPGWELGIGDGTNAGIPYFFNESTGESVWKHPKELIYLKKVKEEKKRIQSERGRKNETSNKSQNQQQNQRKNVSDRNRDNGQNQNQDNENKSNHNDNKNKANKKNNDVEVTEVSDFFQDDDDETPQKPSSNANKNSGSSSSAVTSTWSSSLITLLLPILISSYFVTV
jgi:hypothetical protein